MLPSKLKRKIVEEKVKPNGKGKSEKEDSADAESDYESDQVIFVVPNMCFYLPPQNFMVLGKLPHRDSKR